MASIYSRNLEVGDMLKMKIFHKQNREYILFLLIPLSLLLLMENRIKPKLYSFCWFFYYCRWHRLQEMSCTQWREQLVISLNSRPQGVGCTISVFIIHIHRQKQSRSTYILDTFPMSMTLLKMVCLLSYSTILLWLGLSLLYFLSVHSSS